MRLAETGTGGPLNLYVKCEVLETVNCLELQLCCLLRVLCFSSHSATLFSVHVSEIGHIACGFV